MSAAISLLAATVALVGVGQVLVLTAIFVAIRRLPVALLRTVKFSRAASNGAFDSRVTEHAFTDEQEARLRAIAREELARLMDVRAVAHAEARTAVDQVLSGYGIPQTAGGPERAGA